MTEAYFPRCTVRGLPAGRDCFVGSESGGPEREHTATQEQPVSVPRALGTHLLQRTGLKAVPGRGGGGWLRRGWGPEDGSGTRVSVRSPVYVGLTASVSKEAKGGNNR